MSGKTPVKQPVQLPNTPKPVIQPPKPKPRPKGV